MIKSSVRHKKITSIKFFCEIPVFLDKTNPIASWSQGGKCNCIVIFEWDWPNMKLLRPYWPQTASKLKVEF